MYSERLGLNQRNPFLCLVVNIEVVPVNSFDLVGMPNRYADVMRDHEARELVSVHKHEFYRMLHTGIFESASRKPCGRNEKALRRPRSR